MKTISRHLAICFLFAIVIVFSSFKSAKTNSNTNGGGTADGRIQFSFNAVKQKDGAVVGYIQYGDANYIVSCARWMGKSVILYTTDEHAFYICDNGKPSGSDWISDPIPAECGQQLNSSDFFGMHCVTSGNIQVKE